MSSPDGVSVNTSLVNNSWANVTLESLGPLENLQMIGQGEEGTVYRVQLPINGKLQHVALKIFSELAVNRARENGQPLDTTLPELYGKARAAGLPVMSDFHVIKGDNGKIGVIMTDLSAGGENFVCSSGDLSLLPKLGTQQVLDPFDHLSTPKEQAWLNTLLKSDFSPKSPLIQTMYGYAQKAAQAGILIDHPDSITYVVSQQGDIDIFYPGELSSMHAAAFGKDGQRTADLTGLTANLAIDTNIPLADLISENLHRILSSFATVYRYQEIRKGNTPHSHMSYVNAARKNLGLGMSIG